MNTATITEKLRARFGDDIVRDDAEAADPWIEVRAARLAEICRCLRDEPNLEFNFLHCISGVDYCQPDAKKAKKIDWQPHFELLYHLSSMTRGHRLVLRVVLPRWKNDIQGQLPEVPSVAGVWRTADWHEREVYDLSGVRFVGHPGLRRILCPEDWLGHPLRKDYEMPTEYHGIRAR